MERLDEDASLQEHKVRLLWLEEDQLHRITMLGIHKEGRKASVDWHRLHNAEDIQQGKPAVVFQTCSGIMLSKLQIH